MDYYIINLINTCSVFGLPIRLRITRCVKRDIRAALCLIKICILSTIEVYTFILHYVGSKITIKYD